MRALLRNLPASHDADDVGVLDRRQAMGNDHARAADHESVKRILHELLVLRVERRRRLVCTASRRLSSALTRRCERP